MKRAMVALLCIGDGGSAESGMFWGKGPHLLQLQAD
jgi:hypothetical protein